MYVDHLMTSVASSSASVHELIQMVLAYNYHDLKWTQFFSGHSVLSNNQTLVCTFTWKLPFWPIEKTDTAGCNIYVTLGMEGGMV